ncbi:hydroxyjasmonate sulfotransferase [Ranunculus cassubicifolius]
MPSLEIQVYNKGKESPDFLEAAHPRLFRTHVPYAVLPESVKKSDCKIVYIARNPKDTLVSLWHFMNSVRNPKEGPFPIDVLFEGFCNGVHTFGPFFDHVLEYWKESVKNPEKILFIKYEDMMKDCWVAPAEASDILSI